MQEERPAIFAGRNREGDWRADGSHLGFAQAVQCHEEHSRLMAQAEAQRVHDSHEERILLLTQRENEAQLQVGLMESNLVAAQGQVLASNSVVSSQDAAMNELERAAYDRVSVLEAEVRDAA